MPTALEAALARIEELETEVSSLKTALDWIYAEPEDPLKVQLWAASALGIPADPFTDA
jgi:predicted NAD/FAD-dependent oxidoreductase